MKTKHTYITTFCFAFLLLAATACSSEADPQEATDPNVMTFDVRHPAATRATATQFEAADKVGVYITESGEPLQVSGNYINNALLTYNGTSWMPATPVYYNNGTYNVYAYYPYATLLASVDNYPFDVALDQSAASGGSGMNGYQASDFLWASKPNVTASASAVSLPFAHRMSKMYVRLIAGEDYEGDIPADAEVYIHNTVTSSYIDLSAGSVIANPYGKKQTIRAHNDGNQRYSAIVVPQRLTNRLPLVEVVMKGVSYLVESTFVFKQGIQHVVSVVITKNPEQIKIEIGGEIENWK